MHTGRRVWVAAAFILTFAATSQAQHPRAESDANTQACASDPSGIPVTVAALPAVSLFEFAEADAESAAATTIFLSVLSNSGNWVTVQPESKVQYEVWGILGDDANEGLALIGFDLVFTGGPLEQADTPTGEPDDGCENPMIHFTKPWGITNPAGFGGTPIRGALIQVGGGQNTINNSPDNAAFPIGPVLTGVAQPSGCGPALLVKGELSAPAMRGLYTLRAENVFANVIREGEIGVPFWHTQAATVGTVTSLQIWVGAPPLRFLSRVE